MYEMEVINSSDIPSRTGSREHYKWHELLDAIDKLEIDSKLLEVKFEDKEEMKKARQTVYHYGRRHGKGEWRVSIRSNELTLYIFKVSL